MKKIKLMKKQIISKNAILRLCNIMAALLVVLGIDLISKSNTVGQMIVSSVVSFIGIAWIGLFVYANVILKEENKGL